MDFSAFSDVLHDTVLLEDTVFTDMPLCQQLCEPCSSRFFYILNFNLQFTKSESLLRRTRVRNWQLQLLQQQPFHWGGSEQPSSSFTKVWLVLWSGWGLPSPCWELRVLYDHGILDITMTTKIHMATYSNRKSTRAWLIAQIFQHGTAVSQYR